MGDGSLTAVRISGLGVNLAKTGKNTHDFLVIPL